MEIIRDGRARWAADEIARHILLATALAEKVAAASPERRREVDELIDRLEDAIGVAYRLSPAKGATKRELQLIS
jgi:hypothetical protein